MTTVRGPLEIKAEDEPPFLSQGGNKLSRSRVRKRFLGGMAGESEAQMIAAYTGTPGSAGYVAIEHFTGSIGARTGSFIIQHRGVMARGQAELTATIVPDSGTGELAGISGTLEIDNDNGQHSYVLNYDLPPAPGR